jgi:hypothetical protein
MHITFFGAVGEVAGSCYLVETGEVRFLVDCGLFQGGRDAYRKDLAALEQGNAIIPAFSVGRTQELLFVLTDLIRKGALPTLTIYVDSPMSMAATRLTLKHEAPLDDETLGLLDCQHRHPDSPRVRFVQDVEESMALNTIRQGAVIISARVCRSRPGCIPWVVCPPMRIRGRFWDGWAISAVRPPEPSSFMGKRWPPRAWRLKLRNAMPGAACFCRSAAKPMIYREQKGDNCANAQD